MPTPNIIDTHALWSAQAQMSDIQGKQIVIESAEGSWLTTTEGKKLYDGTAALWFANIGHGRPELAQAAYDQMRKLETYHVFGRYATDKAIELANKVSAIAPMDDTKIIFNSGGSDSIDTACKLARRYWVTQGKPSKSIILSREYAYHGLHAYGTSIAGLDFNREGYGTESLVPDTALVDNNDLAKVEQKILELGPENIAALVAEPVMGTGGVIPPAPGYLQGLEKLSKQYDFLLIIDEVITGFGRTGTMFACERYEIKPDIITMAKGITSGYLPLGGVIIAPRVWEPFYEDSPQAPIFRHGVTYSGHAAAAAVALENIRIIEEEGMLGRVQKLEELLALELKELTKHELVEDVRVAGLLGGVSVNGSLDINKVTDDVIDLGYIVRPLRGNTMQISPPFVTSEQDLKDCVSSIKTVLDRQ